MGYTHYWNQTRVATKKQSTLAQKEIEILLADLPEYTQTAGGFYSDEVLELGNRWGDGNHVINKEEIQVNGAGVSGQDSFDIKWKEKNIGNCKTGRKPYDFAVCLCLLSLAKNIPSFKVGSDGINDYTGEFEDDWQPAIDYYKKVIGDITVTTKGKDTKRFVIS